MQHSATQRSLKLAALLGAVALLVLPLAAMPASGAQTVTQLAFTSQAEGAPVAVLLYEPATGIPVDPGEPHLQATFSYTQTDLETGPKSRALASSIWPGAAIGDGFSTLCECDENWRIRAVAQQPGGEEESAQEIPSFGAGMYARAKGFDAYAEADSGGAPSPEIPVRLANGSSQSTSTVEKGFAVARTVASASDVELLAGVIRIGSVVTEVEALSNAKGARTTGTTTVNGLTIGGNGYIVDGEGLHPVQDGNEADTPLPAPPQDTPGEEQLRDEFGISVHLDEHVTSARSTTATRVAGGLRISIDTEKLRSRFDDSAILELLEQLPEQLDELQAPLYQFLAGAPRIDFVLGRAFVESASVVPYVPPPFPDPPAPGPGTTVPPPTTTAPPESTSGPGISSVGGGSPSSSVATPPAPSSAGPATPVGGPLAASPGETTGTPAASQGPALFAGLPPGLVIGALAAAALAARALGRVGGLAMGTGAGAACAEGSRKNIPNLREL